MNDVNEIIEHESDIMNLEFELASKKFATPDDIGQHREEIVSNFLRKYFPITYPIGKGEIIDSFGNHSNQIDVIICTPYHPFSFSESGRGLLFVEGVACAIDVKSDLSNKSELERGIIQIQSVKKLRRKFDVGQQIHGSQYDTKRIEKVIGIIFSFKSSNPTTLKKNIEEIHERLKIPKEEQIDAVVVHTGGIIYNIKDSEDPLQIGATNERKLGLVGVNWGKQTLMQFLLHLSNIIPREVRWHQIIHFYGLDKYENLQIF